MNGFNRRVSFALGALGFFGALGVLELSARASIDGAPMSSINDPTRRLVLQMNPVLKRSALQFQNALPSPANRPLISQNDELQGAFKAPWTLPESHFNPGFVTSYYNDQDGMMNVSAAPWNQGIASHFGPQIYAYGMKYMGEYDLSASLPVWDPALAGAAF
ncbi:hypothetical protein WDW37_02060 [Bdellovibrionota bacterium FG-1]